MRNKLIISMLSVVALFCVALTATSARSEEGATVSPPVLYNENSLIKSFLLVCDDGHLRYSLSASREKGIKSIEIKTVGRIIDHKECYGASDCMVSGAIAFDQLVSPVVSAQVVAADGSMQKEKTRVNLKTKDVKVYFIGAVPGLSISAPGTPPDLDGDLPEPEIASGAGPEDKPVAGDAKESPGAETVEITVPPKKGPELTIQVRKNGKNDFSIKVVAHDPAGVDFIEILENGSFLDVQICEKKETCAFVKNLKSRKPGRNRYLLKSMNSRGALSFQEEMISYVE